eukprot:TRINITY_DN67802_c3_g1_i5.p1 TRINITY_DN67802_c3_g1~~TRINITY_DN67802_c3_g1_i5.p1  ORF type:complete len:325 (+),score=33.72 TRINITY_DN67802_c3_g1_i5:64-1038(+)
MDELRSQYTAVESAFEEFINNLTSVQDTAYETLLKLKQRRANAELKIANHNQTTNEHKKISLDIGGTTFNTTEGTLLREKDSFFSAMLRSGQFQPDESTGQYFIDRSPQMFGVILDYLRDGKLWTSDRFSPGEQAMLQSELDFYQISLPNQALVWDNTKSNKAGNGIEVSADGRTIQLLQAQAGENIRARTTPFHPHCGMVRFNVRVNTRADGDQPIAATVGVARCTRNTVTVLDLLSGMTAQGKKSVGSAPTAESKAFPKLDFSVEVVYTYRFCYNVKSDEMQVTWPTGQVKKFSSGYPMKEDFLVLTGPSNTSYTLTTEWDL